MSKKTPLPDKNFFILTDQYVTLKELIPDYSNSRAELDLGCGKGDFSVALAARYPESVIIAADLKLGRLRKVVRKSQRDSVEDKLFFMRVEARHLLSYILPDRSLDRLHILCPDPWPKGKHSGHRLLSADLMMHLSRVLKKDGIFHFSTDNTDYLAAVRKNVAESGLFEEAGPSAIADVADVKTEFEMQWLAQGIPVTHVAWKKKEITFAKFEPQHHD